MSQGMKKLVKYVAIVIGVGAALYMISIVVWLGMLFFGLNQNGKAVEGAANYYRGKLAPVVVISGSPTEAKAVPSGDGLTGSRERSYAKAEFTVSGTWYDNALQVRKNLENQGFTTTEKPLESDSVDIQSVKQNFYRAGDALVVEYVFTQTFTCPTGQICGRNPEEQTLDPKFDVNTLAQQPIKAVVVRYGNKDHKESFQY